MNDQLAPADDEAPVSLAFVEQALNERAASDPLVSAPGPWPYLASPQNPAVRTTRPWIRNGSVERRHRRPKRQEGR